MIPGVELPSINDLEDCRAELVAHAVYHCMVCVMACVGYSPGVSDAYLRSQAALASFVLQTCGSGACGSGGPVWFKA